MLFSRVTHRRHNYHLHMSVYRKTCSVDGCNTSRIKNKDISFFHFPVENERLKEWALLVGRPDLAKPETKRKSHHVCSLHFDPDVITYIPKLQRDAKPTLLLPSTTAIPTTSDAETKSIERLNVNVLPSVSIEPVIKSGLVQTAMHSSNTPIRRKLICDLKKSNLKKRILPSKLEKINQEVPTKESQSVDTEDEVTKRLFKLIESNITNDHKGKGYDKGFKLFALNLNISSPPKYKHLKTLLSLPSESTLNTFKINIPPESEDITLELLKVKLAAMPETAKHCTLCLDEIALKRHYDSKKDEMIEQYNINDDATSETASHVYMIMLRGILVNWQQPVTYSYLDSPINYEKFENWLDVAILILSSIGISVRALISDQGSIFDKYAKQVKKVTSEKPYFFVNGQKIYYIFDASDLMKCIRNDLLTDNFVYNDNNISWKHLDTLYRVQQENNLKISPKITEAHIKPNNLQKMCVRYAAQIFSYSVYATLDALISLEHMPQEAKATAEFVGKMNKLFDILNSSSENTYNIFQKALSLKKYQVDVLEEAMTIFGKLRVINPLKGVDNSNKIKTLKNLQMTIQSVIMLCKDFKEEGFECLFTRRLHKDRLENLLGTERLKEDSCRNPTPIQFKRAFSKLFLSSMLKHIPKANSEDICEVLKLITI